MPRPKKRVESFNDLTDRRVHEIGERGCLIFWRDTEDLAEVVAPFYPALAPDVLANAFLRYHGAGLWAGSPEVSREGFTRLAESLLSGGFISRLHAYDGCVDQSLHEQV